MTQTAAYIDHTTKIKGEGRAIHIVNTSKSSQGSYTGKEKIPTKTPENPINQSKTRNNLRDFTNHKVK